MPRRTFCPKLFSKRECWLKYVFLRENLHALMVHLRARGHRAVIAKHDRFLFLGVRDETGSLHLCSNNHEARRHVCRDKKRSKPLYPLFTMWQEKRLVLLKGQTRGRKGLAHLR